MIMSTKKVTLGWDGYPTILTESGHIYMRGVELVIHSDYYPNWPKDRKPNCITEYWPVDPITGKQLEMEQPPKPKIKKKNIFERIIDFIFGLQ